MNGRAFWPSSVEGPMLPPMDKKMLEGSAKKRRREPLESKDKRKTKLLIAGRVFKCKVCNVKATTE